MAAADPNLSILTRLLEQCSLKTACALCAKQEKEITYCLKDIRHECSGTLILAKAKHSRTKWRPISRRPEFPNPSKYMVCRFFVEDLGCTKHHNRCTFARSDEEATVWTFQKHQKINHATLRKLLQAREGPIYRRLDAAAEILNEFAGEFREICSDCFYSNPQTIAFNKWNNTCSAQSKHKWKPLLIHLMSARPDMMVFSDIRPLPPLIFQLMCSRVLNGLPCWQRYTVCQFAHSEVEMAVWQAELKRQLDRRELVPLSQRSPSSSIPQATESRCSEQIYCKACLLTLSSRERFLQHCASQEHARMISEDTTTEWKHRPPPHNRRHQYVLCDRPNLCVYGENCVQAHSVEEQNEWLMRHRESQEKADGIKAYGLMSYRDLLLQEYRNSSNEVLILSEEVDDVTVEHDMDLSVHCERTHSVLKWTFDIKTERLLVHIALLKEEQGAVFTLCAASFEAPCFYTTGERFSTSATSFTIPVYFKSINPGLYEQWLVFDFGMRPVLLQKLKVRVGGLAVSESVEPEEIIWPHVQNLERWHRGNRFIIPCLARRQEEEDLLKEYKPPHMNVLQKPDGRGSTAVTIRNYKEKMHTFLYREELAQEKVVTRLSLQGMVSLMETIYEPTFGLKVAPAGELFATVSVPYSLTPDTTEGFALRRAVHSALIAPPLAQGNVYEAEILREASSENGMYLHLSKRCCSDLKLKGNKDCMMEIQFQISRLHFCEMHKAIDLLEDVELVVPNLMHCCVPVHHVQDSNLNQKQQSAMSFILGDTNGFQPAAPLVIYGPFGTGKTFTLATAAKELVRQPGGRVLICTHTNSSADLYVKDHFHPTVRAGHTEVTPLRIKANKKGVPVTATDEITLQYCSRSSDGQAFCLPDRTSINHFRIVVTTAAMAAELRHLKLPLGYFSHILIDEASQMLECEALIPLGLAGKGTRVVLAGDHMQMGPKLLSVEEDQHSFCTLLNRLFCLYQEQNSSTALKSKIIFNENYRSTKAIVDFVSIHFYVGKRDVIKASGNVPPHPQYYPLRFHHVRGECRMDPATLSWFNQDEITIVVHVVEDLLKTWPREWRNPDQRAICVLSEGIQVGLIRKELRKRNLSNVTVENVENVQGKQFRAVVITTVHTHESLSSESSCLDFFNDSRVLNTAMTRAQSQVVAVGDAAALCMFGKCPKIWKSYIKECILKGSAEPPSLTVNYIEQEIREISKFQKTPSMHEFVDESAEAADSFGLLQQLMENGIGLSGESDDNSEIEVHPVEVQKIESVADADELSSLVRQRPDDFKRGELVLERFDAGYIIPIDEPRRHIKIQGRSNIGKSYPGDEVFVEIQQGLAKVRGKLKCGERVFVCTLEANNFKKPNLDNDYVPIVMVPINSPAPKIRILVHKKNPNTIPIYKHENGRWNMKEVRTFNEDTKRKHVFVVEAAYWKEKNIFPLGYVTDILPVGTSVDGAMKILDEEFKLNVCTPPYVMAAAEAVLTSEKSKIFQRQRKDLTKIKTFTVDRPKSKDLDDAISVREFENHFELGLHISDVVSFITENSVLDRHARKHGATFYAPNKEPNYMFPKSVTTDLFSLLPGQDRRTISLILRVTKKAKFDIIDKRFELCMIRSDERFSYEDAEDIITEGYINDLSFSTLESCLVAVYHFAKTNRKRRLGEDWCYSQPCDTASPGRRKSHLMVEELMIIFNNSVSELLISRDATLEMTPLRCQAGPKQEKLEVLQEMYKDSIPMSSHMSCYIKLNEQQPESKIFSVISSLWKELLAAANQRDVDKIVDLISTDDLHPQLLPATRDFRKLLKAYVIRSNSCSKATVGHYSLHLTSYTRASSPIRRYMDVVLQRLLHGIINNTPIRYSTQEIDILCHEFDTKNKKAKDYEKKAETLSFTINMKKQSTQQTAFVVAIEPEKDSFCVSFPFSKELPEAAIMYGDMQLQDQPRFSNEKKQVTLQWKRRIYSISDSNACLEPKTHKLCNPCVDVTQTAWLEICEAIKHEQWDKAVNIILDKNTIERKVTISGGGAKKSSEKHYVEQDLSLKVGGTLQVQMTTQPAQGYLVPAVQLLIIDEKFEVCLEHAHNPIACFSRVAEQVSKSVFNSAEEYISVWRPLCEMESASNAVVESDGITIDDLEIQWKCQGNKLSGSFFLSTSFIKQCAIECNLAKCFVCIRKAHLESMNSDDKAKLHVDSGFFTWVVHGITTEARENSHNSQDKGKIVLFTINHMPMDIIPKSIFQKSTKFTVELIPKPLPDVRKESAVNNLLSANKLVKSIALGGEIPRSVPGDGIQRWELMRFEPPSGVPKLNETQILAIERALLQNFTLIQGPPGTGKTIVGAYIVYWFLKLNTLRPRAYEDRAERDKNEVILYCGPSNKSVDVVAEYLMKFVDMKPLRVYSRQMEMLEYPYPESVVQLSRKSLRQERSKPQLRSITMHHRIRQSENPKSEKILDFDRRIQNLEQLTELEIEEYKNLLNEARLHELRKHNVILCTCTAASTPNITRSVSARQILIDECAMATEPQALVPLVSHKPEKIVLLGDHKQLRPIVKNELVRNMGMSKSLFERYRSRAIMLETQYRMHKDICEFPSEESYSGKLNTALISRANSVLQIHKKTTHIVFGHITGEEVSLVVTTEAGNENSKANKSEREMVTRIACLLVRAGIQQRDIAVLSPYNAQVAQIRQDLRRNCLQNILATTITKSQGSEWRYVILSTVRSLPSSEIEKEPSRGWLSKNIGFVGDPNQINVGITRAQEGLCIIGNQELLHCSMAWRSLLRFYTAKNCVTLAENISVRV